MLGGNARPSQWRWGKAYSLAVDTRTCICSLKGRAYKKCFAWSAGAGSGKLRKFFCNPLELKPDVMRCLKAIVLVLGEA